MPETKVISRGQRSVIKVNNLVVTEIAGQAVDVSIIDAGNYYTSDNVEGALQEAGAKGLQEVTEQGAATDQDVSINADLTNPKYVSDYQVLVIPVTGLVSWDLNNGQCATLTLDKDVQIDILTSSANARTIILEVTQDTTGGYTIDFITGSDNFGEVDQTQVTTDPNSKTLYVLVLGSDSKYRGTGKTFGA